MPQVRVVEGAGAGEAVELRPGETLEVGRSRDRTGAAEGARARRRADPTVSRLHLRIRAAGGSWVREPCGSSNGTFVNGRRVETCRLAPGDRIRAGDAVLQFEGGGEPPGAGSGASAGEVRGETRSPER
ncbi:MAG: FHA domain-containing protein, partial [Planctomycetota bacterium]